MKAADLRKAILQYAVEGKLVPQDIHDEPASILYEKIIAEKENLIKQGKIKKEKPLPPITNDDIPYNIPENWKWVRLGEVCEIIMGQSPDGNSVNTNNNGIEFHQGKSYFTNYYLDKSNYYTFKPTKIIEKDTLLLSVRAPVGALNFTKNQICIGRGLCGIIPSYCIINQLLFYFLQSMEKSFIKQATGTTFIAISKEIIYKQFFPLPPLKEQERIVKKVDELMALCDKLELEEEKLLALDKNFVENLPKSILQYAVEGKLVNQDIYDEPASILYEKIIAEKENLIKQGKIKKEKPLPPITDDDIPYNIPENWKWVRLGEVCEIKRGNGLTKNDFTDSGIPCIHYGQIHKYYKYSTHTTLSYTSEQVAYKLKTVDYTDIIMVITSENINDVCKSIAWLGNYQIVTGGHTAIIKHWINPLYLIYLFNSNCFQLQKNKIAKGMKVIEVSSEKLKHIIFPLPPLKEQERIVKKVDELLTYCEKLKILYNMKNNKGDEI